MNIKTILDLLKEHLQGKIRRRGWQQHWRQYTVFSIALWCVIAIAGSLFGEAAKGARDCW